MKLHKKGPFAIRKWAAIESKDSEKIIWLNGYKNSIPVKTNIYASKSERLKALLRFRRGMLLDLSFGQK
jgi:hypothetical protein